MDALYIHLAKSLEKIILGRDPHTKIQEEAGFKSVVGLNEVCTIPFWKAVFAEFLAQTLFVFMGLLSTVNLGDNVLGISFAFGLAFMAMIQITGHVSGGHINPAVTIAMAIIKDVSLVQAALYIIAQSVGGIGGALLVKQLTPKRLHHNLGVTSISNDLSIFQGFCIETVLTFVLTSVIFGTTDPNRNQFGSQSLIIGLTVTLCCLSAYSYTGASMNPSRSLGAAVASNSWDDHWVYWFAPIIGGFIAAIMYKFILNPYFHRVTKRKMMSLGNAFKKIDFEADKLPQCTCDSLPPNRDSNSDNKSGKEDDVKELIRTA